VKRNIHFEAAYDKRHEDPPKNYGVHGVHIWFELIDESQGDGLTFSVSTNWNLPHVQKVRDQDLTLLLLKPMPFGVDIHSPRPRYEGQTCRENCSITGGKCYCDGSALLGDKFFQILVEGGDEALWKAMEERLIEWRKK